MAFLSSYVYCGLSGPDDTSPLYPTSQELEITLAKDVFAMANDCMLDPRFKKFAASDVACAIVFWARRSLCVVPAWTSTLTELTVTDPSTPEVVAILDLLAEVRGFSQSVDPLMLSPVAAFNSADEMDSYFPSSCRYQQSENDENKQPLDETPTSSPLVTRTGASSPFVPVPVQTPCTERAQGTVVVALKATKTRPSPVSVAGIIEEEEGVDELEIA